MSAKYRQDKGKVFFMAENRQNRDSRYYTGSFNPKSTPLPKWAKDFISFVASNRSIRTAYNYSESLIAFLQWWLYDNDPPAQLDLKEFFARDVSQVPFSCPENLRTLDIIHYMSFTKTVLNHRDSTRKTRLIAIRELLEYYVRIDKKIPYNVALDYTPPKVEKKLPIFMQAEEFRTLLSCVDGRDRERDYCILVFLLTTGIRGSELCGLDVDDFYSDGQFRVFGKGSKERTLTMNRDLSDALDEYLEVREATIEKIREQGKWVPDEDALFISSQKGSRMTLRRVEQILDKYLLKSGLAGRGYTPHKLRHTYATMLYRSGVPILEIQRILGHESVATTQIYTHLSDSAVQDTMKHFSLLDGKDYE